MKKVITILAGLAVVFLILSAATSFYALNEAKNAIASLGTITYDEQSKEKIDQATVYYDALAVGFGASSHLHDQIDEYVDAQKLDQAQADYITQAIDHLQQASLISPDFDEELENQIFEAREVLDAYFPDQDYSMIPNYELLEALES